ncbi:MAG TPA: hypothetical protein VEI82_00490 [Myxococcota bacterium]|nr:hypothetical protein [Myxococcota bacterium]
MTRIAVRLAASLAVPVALCALALPAPAAAKSKKPVDIKASCQEHVKKKFKEAHPGARDITLTQTREWQESSTMSGVGGTGTVLTQTKQTRSFEWTCVYDTTKNKVDHVDIQKEKEAPAKK